MSAAPSFVAAQPQFCFGPKSHCSKVSVRRRAPNIPQDQICIPVIIKHIKYGTKEKLPKKTFQLSTLRQGVSYPKKIHNTEDNTVSVKCWFRLLLFCKCCWFLYLQCNIELILRIAWSLIHKWLGLVSENQQKPEERYSYLTVCFRSFPRMKLRPYTSNLKVKSQLVPNVFKSDTIGSPDQI